MNYYNEIKDKLLSNQVYKKVKDYSKNKNDLKIYYDIGKLIIEAQCGEGKSKYGSITFEYGTNIIKNLNHYYLKTIHHEFTHILNQTQPYSTSYKLITPDSYVADTWNEAPNNVGYLGRGYISAYSQKEDREDFAEIMSIYITNTAEQWEVWMQEAAETVNANGKTGRQLIEQKLSIVRDYMKKSWDVDMDELRAEILKRQDDVANNNVDLTDLTIY